MYSLKRMFQTDTHALHIFISDRSRRKMTSQERRLHRSIRLTQIVEGSTAGSSVLPPPRGKGPLFQLRPVHRPAAHRLLVDSPAASLPEIGQLCLGSLLFRRDPRVTDHYNNTLAQTSIRDSMFLTSVMLFSEQKAACFSELRKLSQMFNGVEKLDFSQTPKNPPREDALHAPFGTSVSPRHPPFRLSMVKQGVFQHHCSFVTARFVKRRSFKIGLDRRHMPVPT